MARDITYMDCGNESGEHGPKHQLHKLELWNNEGGWARIWTLGSLATVADSRGLTAACWTDAAGMAQTNIFIEMIVQMIVSQNYEKSWKQILECIFVCSFDHVPVYERLGRPADICVHVFVEHEITPVQHSVLGIHALPTIAWGEFLLLSQRQLEKLPGNFQNAIQE
jgi:hypothetical protein